VLGFAIISVIIIKLFKESHLDNKNQKKVLITNLKNNLYYYGKQANI
jgi:hypothetical protein